MKKRKIYHRLSVDDRMTIQACIHDNQNMTQIASRIGVHKSTISREIHRHMLIKNGFPMSHCSHLSQLGLCNSCQSRGQCTKEHHYYNYVEAHIQAESTNKSAHSTSKLLPQQVRLIDSIVTEGVHLGQSLHHIYVSNPVLAKFCVERTIRRLCYLGNLTAKPLPPRIFCLVAKSWTPLNIRLMIHLI